MKIKQVVTLTGITAKNIRFYEDQGLLSPARNKENSYREYGEEDVRTLKTIKILRKLDMPLEQIREVLLGGCPLGEAMERHIEYLHQAIHELEAAEKLCRELADRRCEVSTLDVDRCLDRMIELERQGETFADILHDFKLVADSVEKMRFHFYPQELITTPEEFSDTLLQYAREQKLEITITKESMYPEFTLGGVDYSAMRYTGRFGSVVWVEALHPELLEPPGVPKQRRWRFEWMWRIGFPLAVLLGYPLLILISTWISQSAR